MNRQPNVLITGKKGVGKDMLTSYLCDLPGFTYAGPTSQFIIPRAAAELGITVDEAYEIKDEIRPLLYSTGNDMRCENPTILLEMGYELGTVLNGARNKEEVKIGVQLGIVDFVIHLERDGLPDDETMEYGWDYIVENVPEGKRMLVFNNGTLLDLKNLADEIAAIVSRTGAAT